ncbi:hypothetical protein ACFVR2_01595 [Gottfriedia sp. NPDC057991]|uniref:hypothetical protein n=1 Tax=Gottfriedia sp. NPDC057991 TaxID=3346298 RepID=UPI0036D767CB
MKKSLIATLTFGILFTGTITANAEYKDITVQKTTTICKNVKTTKIIKTTKKIKVKKGKKYIWRTVPTTKKVTSTKKICQNVKYNENVSITVQSDLEPKFLPIFKDRNVSIDYVENGDGKIERIIFTSDPGTYTNEDNNKIIQLVKTEFNLSDDKITCGSYQFTNQDKNWLDLNRN